MTMRPPSLRNRIRNGALAMLVVAMVFGALALPQVDMLGGAIRQTLYRNYISIEASQHMHAALWQLELATHEGRAGAVLVPSRDEFRHWIAIEEGDITEVGEGALAQDIDRRGQSLFDEIGREPGVATDRHNRQFGELHRLLDRLTEINRDAMFRADSRAARLGDRLTYELAAGLFGLLVLGIVLAWTLAWSISKPLAELSDRLRSFSLRGPSSRLGKQPLAELDAVAVEFNKMAERLEQFEKLNVDRLVYEKNKTEAIIESIEDGIVLIDSDGVVTHINEVAAIILGVEPQEALGSTFDDLNSSHPHYLRVRAALESAAHRPLDSQRVEIDLYVRGREHSYILKPVPLRQGDGTSLGTILILQDITYLRDKDRARTNLVATLSHELKTPLTSLALSAELLERKKDKFEPHQRELLGTIVEDVARIRNLANDLLDLARGEAGAISMRTAPVELGELLRAVVKTFRIQAEQKQVALAEETGPLPPILADPVKLSWVVSNLIANALRYTPSGGTIAIAAERAGDMVRLKVRDSGPGVAPEVRDHLFERFSQWNINGTEPGSAGLGLAIAREIVEAHGGRIFVDSAPGEGTCFTVELPVRAEDRWAES